VVVVVDVDVVVAVVAVVVLVVLLVAHEPNAVTSMHSACWHLTSKYYYQQMSTIFNLGPLLTIVSYCHRNDC
jgi:hypothetical protein